MSDALTFVHLSDTHIGPRGQLQYDTDTAANLVAVAERLREMALDPAAIILSGDLTNHGEHDSYVHLRELLETELAPFNAPILLGLGNHDLRIPFRQIMLGEPDWSDETKPYYYSQVIADVRFIMLDSVLPGKVHGYLDPEQLHWLDAELQLGAPRGSVVVIHHPSLPRGVPRADDYLLDNREAFSQVLSRHSVLAVLCGHSHVATSGLFGGTLHVAAAATAYLLDPSIRDGGRGLEGAGFNLCTIRGDRLIVNPVTLPGVQRELYRHYLTFTAMPDREAANV